MNNNIVSMRQFRRFVNSNIYPITSSVIISKIMENFGTSGAMFEPLPQPLIKFEITDDKKESLHNILNNIFIEFFDDEIIIKAIRTNVYNNITNSYDKELINEALSQIRSSNNQYISLLYNVTIIGNDIYLYL